MTLSGWPCLSASHHTSHHITSHTSHHITSHHIPSHPITSHHHITCMPGPRRRSRCSGATSQPCRPPSMRMGSTRTQSHTLTHNSEQLASARAAVDTIAQSCGVRALCHPLFPSHTPQLVVPLNFEVTSPPYPAPVPERLCDVCVLSHLSGVRICLGRFTVPTCAHTTCMQRCDPRSTRRHAPFVP